jgi:uncharacterized DUF497 family protein
MNKKTQFSFEWDEEKNKANIEKHHVSFYEAQKAFLDSQRVILKDLNHSNEEARYFCLGKVEKHILTVRFITRNNSIRIFGAGYWRKGKKIYEKENKVQ